MNICKRKYENKVGKKGFSRREDDIREGNRR